MAHDQFMCKAGYQTPYRSYRMMVSHWPLLWLPMMPWKNKLCCQLLTACHTVWKDATPNTTDIPHLILILDGWRHTDCLIALSGCWPWLFSSLCVICEGDMIYVKNNRSLNFSTKNSSEMIFHRWGRKDRTRGERVVIWWRNCITSKLENVFLILNSYALHWNCPKKGCM